MRLVPLVLVASCALAACGKSPPPAPVEPPQKQKTVFDDQLKALDKAKGVQGTVDQQHQDADKKLEGDGG